MANRTEASATRSNDQRVAVQLGMISTFQGTCALVAAAVQAAEAAGEGNAAGAAADAAAVATPENLVPYGLAVGGPVVLYILFNIYREKLNPRATVRLHWSDLCCPRVVS